MRKLLFACAALAALATPASADIVRPLGGLNWTVNGSTTLLNFSTAQPPGNQPQNNPCIICGANQPNQTNTALGFGYTDYGNQGNLTSEAFFSSGNLRDTGLLSDTISAVNYSGAQLIAVVNALGGINGGFGIGIDVNDTNKPQTLESFFFLDLTSKTVLAAFLPDINDGIDLLAPNNGTGFPDFQLTGLSTNGLVADHQYAFFARMTNINDGPDSFFLTPGVQAAVPELSTWGMMLLGFAGIGTLAYRRRRDGGPSIRVA
jgi:hypothetical protein